jgi:hypothetical protein
MRIVAVSGNVSLFELSKELELWSGEDWEIIKVTKEVVGDEFVFSCTPRHFELTKGNFIVEKSLFSEHVLSEVCLENNTAILDVNVESAYTLPSVVACDIMEAIYD